MPMRLLDNPVVAIAASAVSTMVVAIADAVSGLPEWMTTFTACCGAGTAFFVLLFWFRKMLLICLHDRRDIKNGKLPDVDHEAHD